MCIMVLWFLRCLDGWGSTLPVYACAESDEICDRLSYGMKNQHSLAYGISLVIIHSYNLSISGVSSDMDALRL